MQRAANLDQLEGEFDVLVIGGGATGLGVAVDSATRGYRTVLVEANDFAQGTSSRSTKLVHGGVRYLAQGNVRLVRRALRERGLLIENAPHLVRELRFLIPAYSWWEKPFYGLGLRLYDLLAGSLGLSPVQVLDAGAAARLVPTIKRDRLAGGVLYSDAQFNDTRLAVILARTASAHGAVLLNYAPVESLLKTDGRVRGAVIVDRASGSQRAVRARCVVNATGVFTDAIRRLDTPGAADTVAVSQGIHLLLPARFLPGATALMVPRTADGRVFFVIPWQGRTLVGTTDTPVAGPSLEPQPRAEEIEFVLRHAGVYLREQPSRADVLAVFAGLRPLVKGKGEVTAAFSRDHSLSVSESGLVTITGGKWTTYRHMAEETVNAAAATAGLPSRPCQTARLRLYGADCRQKGWQEFGASAAEIASYQARYRGQLHPRLPYTWAMVAYAIENEMPVRLEDVLARRLRATLLDPEAAREVAPKVTQLMADLQGRDRAWMAAELASLITTDR